MSSMKIKLNLLLLLVIASVNAQDKLLWPLSNSIHDKTYISNYVDQDSTSSFQDYNCGRTHGYNGHLGTDIAVNTFRDSDQGVAVLAAAGGIVTIVRNNQFDRNFWPPYTGSGNGLWIQQDNGDFAIYWHMRKYSVALQVGERVEAGQFLGYVASSGNTPIPHLHFQLNNSSDLNDSKDPFSGDCNNGQSLWENQIPYVSNDPLKVLDFGLTTNHTYNGVYQNGALTELKEKLLEPIVYGKDEEKLGVWVQFQGNNFDKIKINVSKPDGTIYQTQTFTVRSKRRYGWYVHDFPFAVNSPQSGIWRLNISNSNGEIASKEFLVDNKSIYSPRLYPISGKSFLINGQPQNYELIELGLSDTIKYKLIGAPSGFSLSGNRLNIPAISDQIYRNLNFSIAAYNQRGDKDYFRVHVVDHSKSINDFNINKEQTGFWFNPASSGRGFALEVNETSKLVFLAWFTFDTDINTEGGFQLGHNSQRWLTALGSYSGKSIELDINNVSNGIFDSSNQVGNTEPSSYGSITIELEDCNHGKIDYSIHALNLTGSIPIQRLFQTTCK